MENTISAKVFIALQGKRYNTAVKAVIDAGLGNRPMTPQVHKHVAGTLARLQAAALVVYHKPDDPLDPRIKDDLSQAVDAAIAAIKEWQLAASN